jgi:molybdopterin-guanine dinucleotide biosynthesis protein A
MIPAEKSKISAVILAGGQARRMGGVDKGLITLDGLPLITWVMDRIAPQVDELFISANRNLSQYHRFGPPVLPDDTPEFLGPLAGLQRVMVAASHPLILCVPCDTPFLPRNLVERLLDALEGNDADMAVPVAAGQVHRAIFLCRKTLLPGLKHFLDSGGRKVGEWQSQLKCNEVIFDAAEAFLNLNTPEELAASASKTASLREP